MTIIMLTTRAEVMDKGSVEDGRFEKRWTWLIVEESRCWNHMARVFRAGASINS